MKTIHKYRLRLTEMQPVTMPEQAKILSVQIQDGEVCIWAVVDTHSLLKTYHFKLFVTGGQLPDDIHTAYLFIGTFQSEGKVFVYHLFQKL